MYWAPGMLFYTICRVLAPARLPSNANERNRPYTIYPITQTSNFVDLTSANTSLRLVWIGTAQLVVACAALQYRIKLYRI
jgi:hypothetical protein